MTSIPHVVLLVDDNEDTLEMYALGLEIAGYRPLIACDADSALNQLRNGHPAAIVTDLQLVGGRSGWDLINTLKEDPATRQIPIVVLSGHTDPSVAAFAERVGCVPVSKPCLPEELAEVLRRLLPVVM